VTFNAAALHFLDVDVIGYERGCPNDAGAGALMRQRLEPGQEIDGFRIEERLHQGGMAVLWRVTDPTHPLPLIMKVPLIAYGEGPGAIVGFEVEQMILPRLLGPHVPRFRCGSRFFRAALHRDGTVAGRIAPAPRREGAAGAGACGRDRRQGRGGGTRPPWPARN
jgi:hypothetical protein